MQIRDVENRELSRFLNGETSIEDALWLPHEAQLREMLRGTFRCLRRLPDTHQVEMHVAGEEFVFEHPEPADAYALAVRELLRRVA